MLRSPFTLQQHVDRLVLRNAELIVCLRHAIDELHRASHNAAVGWTVCHHARCRQARAIIDQIAEEPR